MQLKDIPQINKWSVKKILLIVLAIQLFVFGLIGLDFLGIHIKLVREVIIIFYLLFIPGFLISRILKIQELNLVKFILYSIGLSLFCLMALGIIINFCYPLIGINKPFSIIPLASTMGILIFSLSMLIYFKERNNTFRIPLFKKSYSLKEVLFLSLIPFFSIFSTFMMNRHNINFFNQLLIPLIGFILILVIFNKIKRNLYPFAIYIIALSLLFHTSLISQHLWGWDIQFEYGLANLVIENGYWNSSLASDYNSMLSVVLVAPILSIMSNIRLEWIFKVIYPIIFALVPVGLYCIVKPQTNSKIAFLSSFFFCSFFVFYFEMVALARQQIAEFFLILLILLIVDREIINFKKKILFICFSFALIVSHYALSYIFIFIILATILLFYLVNSFKLKKIAYRLNISIKSPSKKDYNRTIYLNYILFFSVLAIAWYIFSSQSSNFYAFLTIVDHMGENIFDLLNPETSQGYSILRQSYSNIIASIHEILHLITQFFIMVGIFSLFFKNNDFKFKLEYKFLAIAAFIIAISGILMPHFSSALNTTRLYQITLIFLAPFCIIGGVMLCCQLNKLIKIPITIDFALKLISIFFLIFLLFNTTWIHSFSENNTASISFQSDLDNPSYNYQEYLGAKWIFSMKDQYPIYSDGFRRLIFGRLDYKPSNYLQIDEDNNLQLPENSYIYLGTFNILKNEYLILKKEGVNRFSEYVNITEINSNFLNRNKIYENGGSIILV